METLRHNVIGYHYPTAQPAPPDPTDQAPPLPPPPGPTRGTKGKPANYLRVARGVKAVVRKVFGCATCPPTVAGVWPATQGPRQVRRRRRR
jgi:hypothetical protein